MQKQSYEVEVIVNGKPIKEYQHNNKIYIEGREGTKFSIRIKNNSFSRKLFVPTIDGLSVLDGEEGSLKSGGYVVSGYESLTIDGWRTSNKDVAEFYFSTPEKSYRKRMKKGNNLGIIGVAVFSEIPQTFTFTVPFLGGTTTINPHIFDTFTTDCTSKMFDAVNQLHSLTTDATNMDSVMRCSNSAGSQREREQIQQIGTGWGDKKISEVTTVNFDRQQSPDAVFEILYNTRQELEKLGINFQKHPVYVTPRAFPGDYCKPPKN